VDKLPNSFTPGAVPAAPADVNVVPAIDFTKGDSGQLKEWEE